MNENYPIKHQEQRQQRRRSMQIIGLVQQYCEGKYKVSRQFDYEPGENDLFLAASEIMFAKYPGLVYKAYELYLNSELATDSHLNNLYPDSGQIRLCAREYLLASLVDKEFELDPSYEALVSEARVFCKSLPPGVEVSEGFEFSSSLNLDKLALYAQAIELLDRDASIDEVTSKLKAIDVEDQPLDKDQTSVGIEVEQNQLKIEQIKALDLLRTAGFRIEQDADREIIFPPSNSFKDTIKAWIVLRKLGIITDPESAIHVTLGGLKEPSRFIEDIMIMELMMNAVADFAFRSRDPKLMRGETTSVSFANEKGMLQGKRNWFRGFPFRIKSSGLIEFRNIFTFDFNDTSFVKGMLILDSLFQCLVDHSNSENKESSKWQVLKNNVLREIDAAYKDDGEMPGIMNHLKAYTEFVKFFIWCRSHGLNLATWEIDSTDPEDLQHYENEFKRMMYVASNDPFYIKRNAEINQEVDDTFANQWSSLLNFYAYGSEFRKRTTEIVRMGYANEKQLGRNVYRAIKQAIS